MVRVTQIENLEAHSLLAKFTNLESKLEELKSSFQPQQPTEYLTRQEIAKLLKVSLVTVHAWSNKGILKPHKIANKVRYKRHEVEQALTEIKGGAL